MSQTFSSIISGRSDDRAEANRKAAVTAALELIAAAVSNPSNGSALRDEMTRLSDYADAIEAAIKAR